MIIMEKKNCPVYIYWIYNHEARRGKNQSPKCPKFSYLGIYKFTMA